MNIRSPFTVLDGGLSTVLEARGVDLKHPLWTGRLIIESPETLIEAHGDYLRAGAEVIITASYQSSVAGLEKAGLTRAEAEAALGSTTTLAREAVSRHGSPALVAASVGPYGATRADGSEYRGDYDVDAAQLREFHRRRLDVLVDSAPDLLAVETIPTVFEAHAIAAAIAATGATPSWFSFVCRDEAHTAGGDRIEDAIAMAAGIPGMIAVGVNCTDPRLIGPLLERAATVTDLPLVAYANGGQNWNTAAGAWDGDPIAPDAPAFVASWVASGARMIGGCCGAGPAHIASLRRQRDATAPAR
ncbi:homocysteine S-methyltransferase [Salinibacterium sp.]|uniref:homocysteine S-methyltransferase n=1 Tax=Salinibacterium sp. TaxID=1915057 RepID=UPI00286C21DD|nr:homocysteine S-methyltransferase [Salinibacterium sp.]